MILRRPGNGAAFDLPDGLMQRFRAKLRQPRRQRHRVLVRIDGRLAAQYHISRIQLRRHIHNGHACHSVAVENRPVDGRRAPVLRQDGGVYVDGTVLWRVQDVLRQDTAIGCHHDQLGSKGPHQLQRRTVLHFQRLIYVQSLRQSIFLHRRRDQLHAAVLRLVWLGEHTADVVSVGHQPFEGSHGKIRRSHKQNTHYLSSSSSISYSSACASSHFCSSSPSMSRSVCSTNR